MTLTEKMFDNKKPNFLEESAKYNRYVKSLVEILEIAIQLNNITSARVGTVKS